MKEIKAKLQELSPQKCEVLEFGLDGGRISVTFSDRVHTHYLPGGR